MVKLGLTGLQSRDLFHYKAVTELLKVLHIYNKCCENTKKLLVYRHGRVKLRPVLWFSDNRILDNKPVPKP